MSLTLTVVAERHPEITGTNEEFMVFSWLRCAGPEQAEEVVHLIPKFFLALVEALDDIEATVNKS